MLKLKKINKEDKDKEYEIISSIKEMDNEVENNYYKVSKEDFESTVLPSLLGHEKGIGLDVDYVPDNYYFLWDDNKIIGLYKIRKTLNEYLASGPGHIDCYLEHDYKNEDIATKGLALVIEECKHIIKEKEIYMSSKKGNSISLKAQKANGAYIAEELEHEYLTRIKIK